MKKIIQMSLLTLATGTGVLYGISPHRTVSETCHKEWQIVLRKHNYPLYGSIEKGKIHRLDTVGKIQGHK